jgi:mRNA interferase MazF
VQFEAPEAARLNVVTIPVGLLGRGLGFLPADQEAQLSRAVVLAYDLDIALLDT